jgi:hypothetical protein
MSAATGTLLTQSKSGVVDPGRKYSTVTAPLSMVTAGTLAWAAARMPGQSTYRSSSTPMA